MPIIHKKERNLTTLKNKQNHSIWTLVRKPFPLPTWAIHKHIWENFDTDQAGCLLCGHHHTCDANTCDVIQCEDGSNVCQVTGYCIPCIQVSCKEYSDCTTTHMTQTDHSHEERQRLFELIQTYVLQILGSDMVRANLFNEQRSSQARKAHTMQRICRNMKQECDFDVFKCTARLAYQTRHVREPLILTEKNILKIAERCSSAIILLVNALELFPKNAKDTKLFPNIVGLLYVMRQGITSNNTALLSRVQILNHILPQENYIKHIFNVRSRVITETENMVKMAMRKLSIYNVINKHYRTL
jgi:hypothetical protein